MRPDLWLTRLTIALAALIFSCAALAAPSWRELSPEQRSLIEPALASQGGNFDALPESRRAALVKGVDRWLGMSESQRAEATQQFNTWQQLSPSEKLVVLDRREQFRKLSPDQRKALLGTQQQFLAMPTRQQRELRDEFNRLPQVLQALPAPGVSDAFSAPANPSSPLTLPPAVLPQNGADLGAILPK